MVAYQYRCAEHGVCEVQRPMGSAPAQWPCPECGGDTARVFAAPHLGLADRGRLAAIDATRRSADEPAVVTSVPGSGARRRTPTASDNPVLRRLPKP
ncbi:zinc ribbon domain-containing protein [Rhodococcus sp. X156]|uniref:FmdB family zinc ribbon protein n=1 Tax=Rhodococcus sp. X156 TaxID=2499145 RepID=UPI000FD89C9C|nr:zinc ribbon domain-containing protein [Rhodococcus sp. X156]